MDSAFFVAGLLELVASERPELLGRLVEALEYSPERPGLVQIADLWGLRPEDLTADLGALAARASKHLDRLERRRSGWRDPRQLLADPNVPALASLANARRRRMAGTRARRLDIVRRKVERVAKHEQLRRRLDAFLREPSAPVDLAAFMGWDSE